VHSSRRGLPSESDRKSKGRPLNRKLASAARPTATFKLEKSLPFNERPDLCALIPLVILNDTSHRYEGRIFSRG